MAHSVVVDNGSGADHFSPCSFATSSPVHG